MVKEIKTKFSIYFQCGICKLAYPNKEWAHKCEEFCKNNKGMCNSEIVKHSVEL